MGIDNIVENIPDSTGENELRKFEESELEYFLDSDFNYKEVCDIFGEMSESQYAIIRLATKQGIQTGVDKFLKKDPAQILPSIYCSNIRALFEDSSMQQSMSSLLKDSNPLNYCGNDIKNYDEYSYTAGQTFCTYLYNESYDRFIMQFPHLIKC